MIGLVKVEVEALNMRMNWCDYGIFIRDAELISLVYILSSPSDFVLYQSA